MTWQPIATAPKDGTCVLLYSPNAKNGPQIFIGRLRIYWESVASTNAPLEPTRENITHWHPLPGIPA